MTRSGTEGLRSFRMEGEWKSLETGPQRQLQRLPGSEARVRAGILWQAGWPLTFLAGPLSCRKGKLVRVLRPRQLVWTECLCLSQIHTLKP